MKFSKQLIGKAGLIPAFRWKIKSKSNPGKYHIVGSNGDEKFICDCIAGSMKRPCRHVRIITNHFKGIHDERH